MFDSSLLSPCVERCMPSLTNAASSQDPSLYVKFRSLLMNLAFFTSHVARIISLALSRRSSFLLALVGRTLQTYTVFAAVLAVSIIRLNPSLISSNVVVSLCTSLVPPTMMTFATSVCFSSMSVRSASVAPDLLWTETSDPSFVTGCCTFFSRLLPTSNVVGSNRSSFQRACSLCRLVGAR